MTLPEPPQADSHPRRHCKNPGASVFNRVYSKRNPKTVESLTDHEILTSLLGSPVAATSVLEEIGGSLETYSNMGEGQKLLHCPGVSKATAVKLDLLFEFSARVG